MNANSARTDLYTVVHKSLRRRLFLASIALGATDFDDPAATSAATTTLLDLLAALRAHGEHEEEFIHPLFEEMSPDRARAFEADHETYDAAIVALEKQVLALDGANDLPAWQKLYRSFSRFIGEYLLHLDAEEATLPQMWEYFPEERLRAQMAAFNASRSPEQKMQAAENFIPAMTHRERCALVTHFVQASPRPVYAELMRFAERDLDRASFQRLRGSLERVDGDYVAAY